MGKLDKKERVYGLDLIRCFAFLLVVTFHSFLNNGHSYVAQVGTMVWLADSFRFLSISCIGLYLMLSGYLKCENTSIKSCYRGLLSVLVGYLLACAVCIPVRHFVFDQVYTFDGWIKKIFNFTAVSYGWYVEMFIGLSLLVPFINMALKYIGDNKKRLYILAVALLFMTALPGATKWDIAPDYWRIAYPVTYYVLGAVVYKLQPKINTWLGLLTALATAALLGAHTVLTTDGTYKEFVPQREFQDLWIVFIVFFLFVALYRVNVPQKLGRVLALMSTGCYCGYMLSSLFDCWVYKQFPQFKTPDKYWLLFICATIPIYIVSMLGGILLQKLTDVIVTKKKKSK